MGRGWVGVGVGRGRGRGRICQSETHAWLLG